MYNIIFWLLYALQHALNHISFWSQFPFPLITNDSDCKRHYWYSTRYPLLGQCVFPPDAARLVANGSYLHSSLDKFTWPTGVTSLRKAWADHSQWLVDKEIERSSSFSSSEANMWCHPWPRVPPWDQAETTSLFSFFPFSTLGFPDRSAGKQPACNAGDLGLIPGLGRFPGEGKSYPLQYSGLENSMDCVVHGVGSQRVRHNWVTFISLLYPAYFMFL